MCYDASEGRRCCPSHRAGGPRPPTSCAYCSRCSSPPVSRMWKEGIVRAKMLCLRGGGRGLRFGQRWRGYSTHGGGARAGRQAGRHSHQSAGSQRGSPNGTCASGSACACARLTPGPLTCTCPGRRCRSVRCTAGCAALQAPGWVGGGGGCQAREAGDGDSKSATAGWTLCDEDSRSPPVSTTLKSYHVAVRSGAPSGLHSRRKAVRRAVHSAPLVQRSEHVAASQHSGQRSVAAGAADGGGEGRVPAAGVGEG